VSCSATAQRLPVFACSNSHRSALKNGWRGYQASTGVAFLELLQGQQDGAKLLGT